jgi:hypothetical protein
MQRNCANYNAYINNSLIIFVLHYEKIHNLHISPNIITLINSKRMRWAKHVAHMGEMGNTEFWSGNLKGKDQL